MHYSGKLNTAQPNGMVVGRVNPGPPIVGEVDEEPAAFWQLVLEGLSVNQVDSISWDLTAWLCSKLYQSHISGRKGREMEKCGERDGVR